MAKIRCFITFFLMLITINGTFCQQTNFALKLGYVNSKYVGNNLPGKKIMSVNGITIGGSILKPIRKNIQAQGDLLFTSNGAKINVIGDAYLMHYYFYLESPLLIKYTLIDKPKTPFVLFGPSFRLKILSISEVGILDNIRSYDVGLNIGLGYESRNIILDARYYRGLVNIDKLTEESKIFHSYFSISLALKLRKYD